MDAAPHASATPNPPAGSPAAPAGIVELICGCMFSGKTTRLLELLRPEPPDAVLVVKHAKDARYSHSRVVTHTGAGQPAVTVTCPTDIRAHVTPTTRVVAIDEGHFYADDLPDVCAQLAADGRRVIITALDRDMWGRPFPVVERLRAIAGAVQIQHAICAACRQPATHTYRKTPIVGRNLVGGSADFEPRCPQCWSPPPEPPIDSAEME
ncbi:MAG: thymidine kinase [Phycisphaerales bacterium]|nr:thymidine kinase [Phycisphaerales bacterium]